MSYPIAELELIRPVPYIAINLEDPFDAAAFDSNFETLDPPYHYITGTSCTYESLKFICANNTMYLFDPRVNHKDFPLAIGLVGDITDAGFVTQIIQHDFIADSWRAVQTTLHRYIEGYSGSLGIGGQSNQFRQAYLTPLLSGQFEFLEKFSPSSYPPHKTPTL